MGQKVGKAAYAEVYTTFLNCEWAAAAVVAAAALRCWRR